MTIILLHKYKKLLRIEDKIKTKNLKNCGLHFKTMTDLERFLKVPVTFIFFYFGWKVKSSMDTN